MSPTVSRPRAAPVAVPERELVVRSVSAQSEGVVAITLVDPDGGHLPAWTPGAHIDLALGNGLERQYSLCGSAAQASQWRVAVLREPASRGGSEWVHSRLEAGARLRVRGPRNNFELRGHRLYLFIAGGIGITPLLPMIAAVEARGADWRLLYGGRQRASMAFLDELAAYGDRVTLWPQDERGLLDLDTVLARTHPDTGIYCCGPEPLLAAVEQRCAGRSPGSLRVERFAPRPSSGDAEPDAPFALDLARTGRSIAVGSGQSIIEALEAGGVFPSCSCLAGVCGSCETAVLDGVPEHRDSILDDDERESGQTMMICVSRSRTPRLVLDL